MARAIALPLTRALTASPRRKAPALRLDWMPRPTGFCGLTKQVNRRGATAARQVETPYRHVRLNAGLGRGFLERTQDRVDASLIAWTLRLQPFEHIGIDAKRD